MRKQHRKLGIGFLAAVILCGLMVPEAAQADIGIVNGLTHERQSRTGETYETFILVRNFGTEPASARIYQTDFYFSSDGQQFYTDPGKLERSNAAWITFYPRQVTLAADETAEVRCEIKVPEEGNLRGTYWSLVMVEPLPEIPDEALTEEQRKVQIGIKQIVRYGVQMITHIDDTGTREIKFLKTELLDEGEKKILEVDVENIGERWLRPVLYVELFDDQANHVGKFEAGQLRIYPGTSVRYRVDLTTVSTGRYKAMVIVDNKDEYVFGAELTLDFSPMTSFR